MEERQPGQEGPLSAVLEAAFPQVEQPPDKPGVVTTIKEAINFVREKREILRNQEDARTREVVSLREEAASLRQRADEIDESAKQKIDEGLNDHQLLEELDGHLRKLSELQRTEMELAAQTVQIFEKLRPLR